MGSHVTLTGMNDEHLVELVVHVLVRAKADAFPWIFRRPRHQKFDVPLVHLDDRVLRVENLRIMFPEPNHIFNACLLAGKIDANIPPACTNAWFF